MMEEIDDKMIETQRDQSDGDSNTNSKYLKFVNFLSIIDEVILINLQLQ